MMWATLSECGFTVRPVSSESSRTAVSVMGSPGSLDHQRPATGSPGGGGRCLPLRARGQVAMRWPHHPRAFGDQGGLRPDRAGRRDGRRGNGRAEGSDVGGWWALGAAPGAYAEPSWSPGTLTPNAADDLPLGARGVLTGADGRAYAYLITARRTYEQEALPADLFNLAGAPRLGPDHLRRTVRPSGRPVRQEPRLVRQTHLIRAAGSTSPLGDRPGFRQVPPGLVTVADVAGLPSAAVGRRPSVAAGRGGPGHRTVRRSTRISSGPSVSKRLETSLQQGDH